jgi:hypothetical protein
MREITKKIVRAFEGRQDLIVVNSRTDGQSLWLFDNRIAEWRNDGLWITNADWDSITTKERLNGLTGVNIRQQRGVWLLNGRYWDGSWVHVGDWTNGIETEQNANEPEFDTTSEWIDEGYSEPIYSVFHTLVESDIQSVEQKLNESGIPTKRMESDTDGVYQPNYFLVVRPNDVEKAINILLNN